MKPLDPKTANEIIALTQSNIPVQTICTALGIRESQLDQWLEAGEKEKQRHRVSDLTKFADAYRKAQALGEIDLLTTLKAHAKTDPTLAMKLLEMQERRRRHPAP